MIVAFPTFQGDVQSLHLLLRWIKRLGGCQGFKALIVADSGTQWNDVTEAQELASQSFDEVRVVVNAESVIGWPKGPNSLFLTSCRYVGESWKEPWLWLETDAIPTKPGWLNAIDAEYRQSGARVLGVIVPRGTSADTLPEKHVNGNAVYPPDAVSFYAKFCGGDKAFDIAAAEELVPITTHTNLIQHFWGQKNLAPTFAEQRGAGMPENAMTMANLSPNAVVFHRNGDGTLINILWRKLYPQDHQEKNLTVVLPYCNRDYNLLARDLEWMHQLHGQVAFRAILSTDDHTIAQFKQDIERKASLVFGTVIKHNYSAPKIEKWPQAANWAFMQSAQYVHRTIKGPWLWLEADAVPIQPDWVTRLDQAYRQCGKPFFGPIVPRLGHMNGVSVYPADMVNRCPKALSQWEHGAWDTAMKPEMIHDCFDASALIQHVWGFHEGKPHPYIGSAMCFNSQESLRWLSPTAVLFHRCKDGSLITQLQRARLTHEGLYSHRQPPPRQRMAPLVPNVNLPVRY